jgi:hypothetical protein
MDAEASQVRRLRFSSLVSDRHTLGDYHFRWFYASL